MTINETQIRRALTRQGLRLCKSRARRPDDPTFGRFHVVDDRNVVVFGATFNEFDASLEEVARAYQPS